jgi:hypothetical protein
MYVHQLQIQRYISASASLLEIILNRYMPLNGIDKSGLMWVSVNPPAKTPIQTIPSGNTDYVKSFVLFATF